MRALFIIFALAVYVTLFSYSGLSSWESLSVAMLVFFFLDFLNNLGKKMVIFDLTILLAIITCLIMPAVFYHVYTRQNHLAKIWVKYMFVSSDDYFSFALPAILSMILGFRVSLGKKHINKEPVQYMNRMKEVVRDKQNTGVILIGVGLVSGFFTLVVPGGLTQFFVFLARLIYVGVFYVLYSEGKQKKKVVPFVIFLMLGSSLAIGMFGEMIYISAVSVILIFLGNKTPFWKKLSVSLAGVYMIMLVQSVKMDYRKEAWRGENGGFVYFAQLIADRVSNPSEMFNEKAAFAGAVRLNQGWLVGCTMYFVPDKHPYADGETIWKSLLAAAVPRFIWPDKPETGGKANLKRFWGYTLSGYSMNIGPLGEAYGNFGKAGGIIYMFFYGLFFNFILSQVLKMTRKRPTIILWVPFLFSGSITFETDVLGTSGVLLKGLLFTWIIFKIFKLGFKIDL